jgi:hypothetical protein
MAEIVDNSGRSFQCKNCLKFYSSYKSLWKHNNIYHKHTILNSSETVLTNSDNILINSDTINQSTNVKTYNCRICNKNFHNVKTRWSHEKTCKEKKKAEETERLEMLKIENKNLELKIELVKLGGNTSHSHNTTTNTSHSHNTTNTNNSHNTTTNNTNNNNIFIKYTNVSQAYDLLTKKEKLEILGQHDLLEESIKKIHFNENLPECNTVFITSLKNNFGYVFDGEKISVKTKHEMLNEIIDSHFDEIYSSIDKFKLKQTIIDKIQKLKHNLYNNKKTYTDIYNKSHKSYKDYKLELIKLLIFDLTDNEKLLQIKNLDKIYEKIEIDNDDTHEI